MLTNDLNITAIPAFGDNYIWLLTAGGKTCAVVDPGDEDPVLEVLEERGLDLRYILLTHHHPDHAGAYPNCLSDMMRRFLALPMTGFLLCTRFAGKVTRFNYPT